MLRKALRLCSLILTVAILLSAGWSANGKEARKRFHFANTPDEFLPHGDLTVYREFFTSQQKFWGAGREKPEPTNIPEVKVGFIGPLTAEDGPILPPGFKTPIQKDDIMAVWGRNMLRAAMLAVEEANKAGGYKGKPFVLVKRTELVQWGQTSNELVQFTYKDKVWAILTGIDSNNNHVLARVTLKTEMPMVNAGDTDPTLLEIIIPWTIHTIIDDRQYSYALLDYIYRVKGFRRVAVMHDEHRDGREGRAEFVEGAEKIGNQTLIDLPFKRGDTDFSYKLKRIQPLDVQAIVLWGNPKELGLIVKQMRQMGMRQSVFGFSRMVDPVFLKVTGPAAEGTVAVSSVNLDSTDPLWLGFKGRYKQRFGVEPDTFAACAYDGMNLIVQAIRKAGLNRARIRDALFSYKIYRGATGEMLFDTIMSNVSTPWLAVVRNGRFHYFPARKWKNFLPSGGY